ncbi:hypothetical protein [Haploplasma axanthum]|nr:hypothetical protein [Haploplasma axanthum]
MRQKYDSVFADSKYNYFLTSNKVEVRDNDNKKQHVFKIKNVSSVISDVEYNFIALTTTETKIYLYDFTFKLLEIFSLDQEVFSVLYDKKSRLIISSFTDISHKKASIFTINPILKKLNIKTIPGLAVYSPYKVDGDTIIMIKTIIADEMKKALLIHLDKTSLEIVEVLETAFDGGLFTLINHGPYVYDYTGIYNFEDNQFIYFKDLNIKSNHLRIIKEINNKYIFIFYEEVLIYDKSFKLISKYKSKTTTNAVFGLLEDDDTILDVLVENGTEIIVMNNRVEFNDVSNSILGIY